MILIILKEVGIKLSILPTINDDGYITTSVTPEVSSIYDMIGPDRNIPHIKNINAANIKVKKTYQKTNRVGDHIWYVSDTKKFRKHYPNWKQKYGTKKIIEELIYSFK